MFFTGITSLALASLVAAAPTPRAPVRELRKTTGSVTGQYIVTLKDGVSKHDVMDVMSSNVMAEWSIIPGFAVEANEETLSTLLSHPDVEVVEEEGMYHPFGLTTDEDAPWGLSRMSSDSKLPSANTGGSYPYTYDDDAAGSGVDIYILDTGVNVEHEQFGGRARWGEVYGGWVQDDIEGHGTHVAGIAASAMFGVAKKAEIIAVKVLGDYGQPGSVSSIVLGVNYVVNSARESGRPSVANMSFGGPGSYAVEKSIEAAVKAGVHMVAAAGNDNSNAEQVIPAGIPEVVTVGATDIHDARASYSNYGDIVDIFAPGTGVRSTWIGSSTATTTISGTSMASPHVAGLIAYLISQDGDATPAAMTDKLQATAQEGVIGRIPYLTVNLLAHLPSA